MAKIMKVVVAAVLGYVVGVLVAPKSGRENRDDLRTKANEVSERVRTKARSVNDALRDTASSVKEGATGTLHRGEHKSPVEPRL